MSNFNTALLCDDDQMEEISEFEKKEQIHWSGMKILNLLKSFSRHLAFDKHKQYQQINSYNKLLKKLEEKEKFLNNKLEVEKIENNRKTIEMRLAVNCVQRKKAIAALYQLKNSI
ncbi:MAG: hypothetical protein QNL62_08310 [Gammaproteobacteria bacterium]|nr:hypothetical protein [Gammaproteobacteria bacterium]